MPSYWDDLLLRVQSIRDVLKKSKIPLKSGEGLTEALAEAEATARGIACGKPATIENVLLGVDSCHVMWALSEDLQNCAEAGLDVANHLRQLTTGTINFGTPANDAQGKTIFFKDFEAELFVAGQLARARLPVRFTDQPNDPRGEMLVGDIFIEVKHPNSLKRLDSLMRKFNGTLSKDHACGVFVTALEDALNLADQRTFETKKEFVAWQQGKRSQAEAFGREAIARAVTLPAIAGLAQISSCVEVVGDATGFRRYSNSLVFDQRQYPHDILKQVERIAAVFNPQFRRYSQVQHLFAAKGGR